MSRNRGRVLEPASPELLTSVQRFIFEVPLEVPLELPLWAGRAYRMQNHVLSSLDGYTGDGAAMQAGEITTRTTTGRCLITYPIQAPRTAA
jgi:hypothetical protein